MYNLVIVLIAYTFATLAYGFGKISRGSLRNQIQGLGFLLLLVVAISSLFFLGFKEVVLSLVTLFLLIMPISGLLMALLEAYIFKDSLDARERVSNRTGISVTELEKLKNRTTADDFEDAKQLLMDIGIDIDKKMFTNQINTENEVPKAFLVGGVRKGINEGKPYYGYGAKLLEETENGWRIVISPIQSEFLHEPKEVDEKTFISTMLSLGVKPITIYEFIKYEVDWDSF